jgi:hypothetical protein
MFPTNFIFKEAKQRITNINFNVDLFMHFIILFSFLTILFIYLISKLSTNAFNGEVGHLLKDIIHKNTEKMKKDPSFENNSKLLPLDKLHKMFNKQDPTVKTHNEAIIRLIVTINILLWLFFIVLILVLKYNTDSNLNLKEIIFENLVLFAFVGFVEYLFFTKIALKFIPVEPSFISKQFLDALKNKFKSNMTTDSNTGDLQGKVYSQLPKELKSQIPKNIPSQIPKELQTLIPKELQTQISQDIPSQLYSQLPTELQQQFNDYKQ